MSTEHSDPDCLFCRIVAGDVPASVVHESEHSIAFRDITPQAPTHVLVIPRRHVPDVASLTAAAPDELVDLMRLIPVVAESEGLDEGYRTVANTGAAANQLVFHAHVHVLGGRSMQWPPG
jgi:histidine triad (HIT) family protein